MKALIVSSATSDKDNTQTSLFYIATALKKHDISFEVLDLSGEIDYFDPPEEFLSSIDSKYWLSSRIFYEGDWLDSYLPDIYEDVDVIYYSSLFSPDILVHGRHLVNQRKVNSNVIGVIGGAALKHLSNEQEIILTGIFDKVHKNGAFGRISPDYSLIDIRSFVTVYSGEGCHWGKCRFCNSGTSCFHRASKDVANDLEQLSSLGCKDMMLSSDTFTYNYLIELALDLEQRRLEVPYNIMLRGERWISKELAFLLQQSGCSDVFIGAESFSDDILKVLNKGITVNNIATAAESLSKYVKIIFGLILFIPGIRQEQLDDQLRNLEEVLPHASSFEPEVLSVMQGTEFAKNPKKYGIQLWTNQNINDAWCYGFSPDIPWTPINRAELNMWFDHCSKLQKLLGNLVHPRYWESVDAIKERF